MGHVHLQVADIPSTIGFYRDELGFDLMAALGGQAAFLAAGGYHHHVGANTWNSAGAGPPPPRLRGPPPRHDRATDRGGARFPGRPAEAGAPIEQAPEGPLVRDPSGNGLVLVPA